MPQNSAPASSSALSSARPRTAVGLVTYCFEIAKRASGQVPGVPDFKDPLIFLKQASLLGANSVQIAFGVMDAQAVRTIRDFAAKTGLHLESTVSLPRSPADSAKFEAELRTLRELGVQVARTVIFPGRRYEQFRTMDEYRSAAATGRKAVVFAEPFAKKHGVRLAIENHKDQRTDERLKLLEEFNSEWIGATLDVGNSIALLEDPVEVARAFAPWTLTVHFKDQGVREYEDGFLLADTPVGTGCIDLRKIIALIREKKPDVRFQLELITRDALKVPIFRDDYWPTFQAMKARELAEAIQRLKKLSSPNPFPTVSTLPLADRVRVERTNIEQSLQYAAEHLGFSV